MPEKRLCDEYGLVNLLQLIPNMRYYYRQKGYIHREPLAGKLHGRFGRAGGGSGHSAAASPDPTAGSAPDTTGDRSDGRGGPRRWSKSTAGAGWA